MFCCTTRARDGFRSMFIVVFLSASAADSAAAQAIPPGHVDDFAGHPRLVVLSDIGNEPDDQMSLVRLLLYSNEIELQALVATTSTWQKEQVQPQIMRRVIAAYGEVRPNLLKHAPGWPEAAALEGMVVAGQPAYGMAAVGPGRTTAGSDAIRQAGDRPDPRPLWIAVWGGANTLAQALFDLRATRSREQVDRFVSRLRVRSISDQDDAGAWIRREFPNLLYIVEPSSADSGDSLYATWSGISGDAYYRNCDGADGSTVTNEWLDANVRAVGPLGKVYPRFLFIMEGDTPSFLGLTDNGLRSYGNPSWGGWGGRYVYRQPRAETHPFWTQGGDLFGRVTSQDTVVGKDGRTYVSDQATIWRWRRDFQHDFAGRMAWTIKAYGEANHRPSLTVNGSAGTAPIVIDAEVGRPVVLDAGASRDPDGNRLVYRWFPYQEAGFVPGANLAAVSIDGAGGARATVTPIAACRPDWFRTERPCPSGIAHVILAVTDDGAPALTSYRRVILNVRAARHPEP